MGGGVGELGRRAEAVFAAVDQPFLLDARQRAARRGCRLVKSVGVGKCLGFVAIVRKNADRSDTVGAIVEEKAEIVLIGRSADARLATAEPAFWAEMLEKGNEAATPEMLADVGGQGTTDRLLPAVVIGEARVTAFADFAEDAGALALIGDNGCTIRDRFFPFKIFCAVILSDNLVKSIFIKTKFIITFL